MKFTECNLQDLQFINETYLYPYLSFVKENQRVFSAVLSQPAAFDTNTIFQKLFDKFLLTPSAYPTLTVATVIFLLHTKLRP